MRNIVVITPVFNDWDCLNQLAQALENEALEHHFSIEIIVVNDYSTIILDKINTGSRLKISQINLSHNVGHQRAICIGLCHLNQTQQDFDAVVVMDSDGEDRPADISKLLEKAQETAFKKIIFARRKKRKESRIFRISYFFYRILFRLLTGKRISFGNFSLIPARFISPIVSDANCWNHFSGSIIHSRLLYETVSIERGKRYFGTSKMNFINLITHGFSSIAVYTEVVVIRLLLFSMASSVIAISSIITVMCIKVFTQFAIPGWASSMSLLILNIALQFALVSLIITLLTLFNRKNIQLPPKKYYHDFIDNIETVN